MTTAEHIRSIASSKSEVTIAAVPWPLYKIVALVAGFVVAMVVGIVAMDMAPAVLTGAAIGTLIWIVLGSVQRARR